MILPPTNPPALVLAGLTLCIAAVVAWLGGSVTAYWVAAFFVLVAALIPQSLLCSSSSPSSTAMVDSLNPGTVMGVVAASRPLQGAA
jgi:Flp pilus assembly protein TadB